MTENGENQRDDACPPSEQGAFSRGNQRSAVEGQALGDRYHVEELVGIGSIATVYCVLDLELDEWCAAKVIDLRLSQIGGVSKMVRQAFRRARHLVHPNVCQLYDCRELGGEQFITMEWSDGESLEDFIELGTLLDFSLGQRLELLTQLLDALALAHDMGLVHGSLHPGNILIEGCSRVLLTDFALAMAAPSQAVWEWASRLGFCAPEVIMGEVPDEISDLFSLGLLAFTLIAGQPPFAIPDLEAARQLAKEQPAVPRLPSRCAPDERRHELDEALQQIIVFDARRRLSGVRDAARLLGVAIGGRYGSEEIRRKLKTTHGAERAAKLRERAVAGRQPEPFERSEVEIAGAELAGSAGVAATPVQEEAPKRRDVERPRSAPRRAILANGRHARPSSRTMRRPVQNRIATILHFRLESEWSSETEHPLYSEELSEDEWIERVRRSDAEMDEFERLIADFGGTPHHHSG